MILFMNGINLKKGGKMRMKHRKKSWLLILIPWLGIHLAAVVVSNTNQLVNAINHANSGGDKEIILKDGTYLLNDSLPIWEDGITVRSQSGNRDKVIIKGQGMSGSVGFIFYGPGSNFTVRDMTIGWVANHAIQIWGHENASNILISNLRIVDTYEQMVKITYEPSNPNRSANGVMENCLLEYSAGVGPQYYIGGIDGHQCKNWTVRGNTFKNISSPGGDVAEHAIHFWSDSQDTLVENNLIIDCDRGIGFGLGSSGHVRGIIRNNMIYHSAADHGFADVSIGLENAANARVYNNTIYMKNSYPRAIEYRFSGTSGGIIKNNLCNKAITSRDGGSADLGSNLTNAQAGWFVNVGSGNLHLASRVTPVVDRGAAIPGLTADYDGDSRPQDAGIDIGADEYTSPGEGKPSISLNRTQMYFGAASPGIVTGEQTFLIENAGEGTLKWSISSDASWLNAIPGSGTGSGVIRVSVNPSGLTVDNYSGALTITDPNAANSPQALSVTLKVYQTGATTDPFGEFATPIHGSTVMSSIPVTGWVLDDIEVMSVKIYNGPDYVGDAVLVEGARPDVEAAYPGYPKNDRAGWGYMMLTNFLPNGGNGTYNIYARAIDAEGHQVTLGVKTIIGDNANAVKPFGAIDTPGQGGTAAGGSFINWGWVLTPQPNSIPPDGSTIDVYVDGVYLGHPTYNIYRPDIASLFPGYANSSGAAGYFYLDTKTYKNGVHTIQWVAADDAGNTDGIGSRYFTIQNTGSDTSEQ